MGASLSPSPGYWEGPAGCSARGCKTPLWLGNGWVAPPRPWRPWLPEPALLERGATGANDVLPLGGSDQGGVAGQVFPHLAEGDLLDVGDGCPGAFEPAALDGAAGESRRIQPVVHPRVLRRDHRAEIAVAVEPGLGAVEAAVVVVPVGGFVEVVGENQRPVFAHLRHLHRDDQGLVV